MERAPGALRAAGLLERLRGIGYDVTDYGDIPAQTWQQDEESPRMRNLAGVLAGLNALRPQAELAAKSGALLLVLGGECTMTMATLAGLRRYFRSVNLIWLDADADLNVPATSPSGCVHGMALAHIVGRGAPELVRFWNEPPLVREPDVALYGLDRLDPPERALLESSPIKRYTSGDILARGAAVTAAELLERLHAASRDFMIHLDADVIAAEDFSACDFPGTGGLRLPMVRQALEVLAARQRLLALQVASYNPEKDGDGAGARLLVDLVAGALEARLRALSAAEAAPGQEQRTEPLAAATAAMAAESAAEKEAAPPPESAEPIPSMPEGSAAPPREEIAAPSAAEPPAASAAEPETWSSDSLEESEM
jgi:arginase